MLLPGRENQSIWGDDGHYLFEQVSRNGASNADGPEFWIMPPRYPVARTVDQLGALIAHGTHADVDAVITAMTLVGDQVGFFDGKAHSRVPFW